MGKEGVGAEGMGSDGVGSDGVGMGLDGVGTNELGTNVVDTAKEGLALGLPCILAISTGGALGIKDGALVGTISFESSNIETFPKSEKFWTPKDRNSLRKSVVKSRRDLLSVPRLRNLLPSTVSNSGLEDSPHPLQRASAIHCVSK